jgi:uncharacterized protein (TIGR03435 family)
MISICHIPGLAAGNAAQGSADGASIDTSGPTIFEAVRKQLRLNLERQKGPAETLVIDHAEKPVEN